ncbi:MAG: VanZ family protein [Chloroflexi bacterium]|nr:MAG: VanZ family protein [Chloroflexota bacterium]RLC88089.1 MAG: VanZ family protein [Chloroflexota bacterium]
MKQFFRYWLPPLAWMGLIFFFSAQPDLPSAPGPWLDTLLKKIGHALGYGILAWLYLRLLVARRALRGRFRHPAAARAIALCLTMAYALSDEYHQTFVPGRNGTLWDVGVDGLGALGAMLLAQRLQRRQTTARQETGAQ